MSVVAPFIVECARNGRWVRGILALHGCLESEDVDVSKARIELATKVLKKHWLTALSMVRANDISHVDELSYFIYECSRSAYVPSEVYFKAVTTLLRIAKGNDEIQNCLFVSAIKWTTWYQALQFFTQMESIKEQSIRELANWLNYCQQTENEEKKTAVELALGRLYSCKVHNTSAKSRNQLQLRWAVPAVSPSDQQQHEIVEALEALKPGKYLSMMSLMNLAKEAMRGKHVSWKLPLSIVSKHRVVEDSNDIFAKMVGSCCPHFWQAALGHFQLGEKLALWLASRHSWRAGLIMYKSTLLPIPVKYDILSRCAIPTPELRKLVVVSKAKKRVSDPSKRAVAVALASGHTMEEIQLSAFAKVCQREGDWESSLYLFDRIAIEEFQRRAIYCLLRHCPNITVKRVLQLVDHRHPAGTSTASIIIKHSTDWMEALYALHYIMLRGTQCNPQILSALMDTQPPLQILQMVIGKLKQATNEGILCRLKSLERDSLMP